jgi:shikimate dehydrogenase
MPEQYGLIGYPLTHSFSPDYFREKFEKEGIDAVYEAFSLEQISELPALLESHPRLRGLNVTTPYKQAVVTYMRSISEDVAAIGAVNCISIEDGELVGHNTDWIGFRDSLIPLLTPRLWPALVLGNGGASQAVQYALEQLGIAFTIVSRSKGEGVLAYEEVSADVLERHPIIINTTTLGTLGERKPEIPYEQVSEGHLLYDLVYNPALTPFLKEGLAKGATVKNGMEMLRLQAEASWNIWQEF